MIRLLILIVAAGFAMGASCLDFSAADGTSVDDSGQPSLLDGDFPEESPCSDRDTLPTDAAFLDAITNATEVIVIRKEYTDDEALPAVCGLSDVDNALETGETGWDPDEGSDENVCYTLEDSLSSYFVAGSGEPDEDNNPGVCRSSFAFDTDNTADGFPRAGTYRIDGCIEGEEGSYLFRTRMIVSGEDVNKTLALAAVEGVSSLEVFNSAGTEATTTDEAKEAFVDNPNGFTFTIRSGDGLNTHVSVNVRVICVTQSSGSCPTPSQGCN